MKLAISVQGGVTTQIDIKNLSQEIRAELKKIIMENAQAIVENAQMFAPFWKGKFLSTINKKFFEKRMVAVVRPGIRYGAWVEYGSGKLGLQTAEFDFRHRVPIGFPNVESIKPWALSKGLNPFLVARGIWKRGGIKPRLSIDRAAEMQSDIFIHDVETMLEDRIRLFNRA